MIEHEQGVLQVPTPVKRDTLAYRAEVQRFLQGGIAADDFRAYRVPMGIYEQREQGTYMVRIRIGAGQVQPNQLRRVAELSEIYGNGLVHVTTRQDLQLHGVALEDTPVILEKLLEVDLVTRGGGGNTVRNVSACARAGVCAREVFDVAPHALAVAEYLMQFDASYALPRKFKIAFSGCSEDCGLASIADLGFVAKRRDGQRGFSVYAAGGLGRQSAPGIRIEGFVPEDEVFAVAEAMRRLFDEHGDRENRRRARLRFVLSRLGIEQFLAEYQKQRRRLAEEGLPGDSVDLEAYGRRLGSLPEQQPKAAPGDSLQGVPSVSDLFPEKRTGFYTQRLRLARGDIPAADLRKVADIAAVYSQGTIRTTQDQDLLITSVPKASLSAIRGELRNLSIHVFNAGVPSVVACAGAATCKLGLCRSRDLATAIMEAFSAVEIPGAAHDAVIRISGCPNSCGQHLLGDIGLQGRARRVGERLVPCYDLFYGAVVQEGQTVLAQKVGTILARRLPGLLVDLWQQPHIDRDILDQVIQCYDDLSVDGLTEDDSRDWGSDTLFSLTGCGPGECGAGATQVRQTRAAQPTLPLIEIEEHHFRVDLRGLGCPLNVVKARLALDQVEVGQVLDILIDSGEPVQNVPGSFERQGQEILGITREENHYCVKIRRNT